MNHKNIVAKEAIVEEIHSLAKANESSYRFRIPRLKCC